MVSSCFELVKKKGSYKTGGAREGTFRTTAAIALAATRVVSV
jgi:hypothetical protein